MAEENTRRPREERFPVAFMCEVLGVSRSGYYAWIRREPPKRQLDDEFLTELITQVHEEFEETYGFARIHGEMA